MGATPSTELFTIHNADALLVLASMPDESIDSIVTDPPYELGFMGKRWDATGIAYNQDLWAECLRVLKPGGHLLAFGGTRTYHRMAVAIEDAGFEIRDSIAHHYGAIPVFGSLEWVYGSGFPKSLDVSKAIDKMAGAERKVVGSKRVSPKGVSGAETRSATAAGAFGGEAKDVPVTAPATDDAATWQGWGTALKPSHEPIVVARKPLAGTVAQTVLEYGTGALNIDGCRVGTDPITINGQGNDNFFRGNFSGKIDNPHRVGRWPANTILTHSAGCRKTGESNDTMTGGFGNGGIGMSEIGAEEQSAGKGAEWQERKTTVALYACEQGCPVAEMDKQSGTSKSSDSKWEGENNAPIYGKYNKGIRQATYSDKGGASRFFTQCEWDAELDAPFLYVAKPSKKERNAGLDGLEEKPIVTFQTGNGASGKPSSISEGRNTAYKNTHPTVKPVTLMRHLVRLVTPPGGTVLDPFLGSGTTGVAALLEGFQFIGIEMTAEYLPIIEGRLAHALASVQEQAEKQPDLFSA